MASKDYFLKIEGIDGESSDAKHKNEIDVESFEWAESHTIVYGSHSEGSKPKVQMQDVRFTMFASKASTKLMTACTTGQSFLKATFTLRKAGSDQQEYMKFTFFDVRIASYSIGGPATESSKQEKVGHEKRENPLPLEQIAMNFAEIEVEYREQKSIGDLGGKNKFKYNLKQARIS